jgi:hypothetical protein
VKSFSSGKIEGAIGYNQPVARGDYLVIKSGRNESRVTKAEAADYRPRLRFE